MWLLLLQGHIGGHHRWMLGHTQPPSAPSPQAPRGAPLRPGSTGLLDGTPRSSTHRSDKRRLPQLPPPSHRDCGTHAPPRGRQRALRGSPVAAGGVRAARPVGLPGAEPGPAAHRAAAPRRAPTAWGSVAALSGVCCAGRGSRRGSWGVGPRGASVGARPLGAVPGTTPRWAAAASDPELEGPGLRDREPPAGGAGTAAGDRGTGPGPGPAGARLLAGSHLAGSRGVAPDPGSCRRRRRERPGPAPQLGSCCSSGRAQQQLLCAAACPNPGLESIALC
ncbi:translation initiation factor IF-2-like [Coturnix japonica]|uniref:translation initiation factor IF-2-like n=1 Tax=Coturnix japonica TaxID=93934 RepID=UPI0007774CC9|nr:translation initiation factor IF-2-like [Coturnix japonica]XP_015728956.1 translation initiation factor IF-2-like [Coturnix japonica]